MADDFYGYDDEADEPKGHDNLFLWTVFILLLIGLASGCWLGSFYVFGHPEHPKAYEILKKLKKIEPPRRFEVTAAPQGEYLSPLRLFERYSKFTRLELERENAELIRNYIRNFRETKKLAPYITGRFVILDSYDLKKTDHMFPAGVVALAQSADFPQVLIEHVYTSSPRNVPALRAMLQTGLDMKLERTNDLAAVVHVEKIADGRLQFTVVPLLYGAYALRQGSGTFSLEPPPDLNMVPGLPVIKTQVLQDGLKKFADYKRAHPAPAVEPAAPGATPAPTGPELVRVDTVEPGKPVPETGAMPTVAVATPVPIPGRATPYPSPGRTTPKQIAAATLAPTPPRSQMTMLAATPVPPVVSPIVPVATPLPASATPLPLTATPLPKTAPSGVQLQPFIAAQRDPNMPNAGATWRTYQAGQVPPARAISLEEAGPLADRGDVGERLYLRGEFRVTASGANRAVLRDATKPDDQSPRVVVEYPAGSVPPPERERFVRDTDRPYLVSDVRRGADGVVTIYVREIINQ
jgi:hypothetical protein